MVKRIAFLYACLLLASPVAAATIVTWEAAGEVTDVWRGGGFPTPIPPIGTPISMTLTFAPAQARPHFTGTPGCMVVDLSGSITIGGHTWTGGGLGFTHAQLPGDSCSGSNLTQFSLHSLTAPPDHPWQSDHPFALGPPPAFVLSYEDLLIRDAFPDVPTTSGAWLFTVSSGHDAWNLTAALDFRAVEQSAPVPEPGTLALLGLGLAAAARARKQK